MLEIGTFRFPQICVTAPLCAFIPDHKYLNHWFLTLPESDKSLPLPHYSSKSNPWTWYLPFFCSYQRLHCFCQTPAVKHEVFTTDSQILHWSHSKVRNVHQGTTWICGCHSQLSLSLFHSEPFHSWSWHRGRAGTPSGALCSACPAWRSWRGISVLLANAERWSFLLSSGKAWAFSWFEIHIWTVHSKEHPVFQITRPLPCHRHWLSVTRGIETKFKMSALSIYFYC